MKNIIRQMRNNFNGGYVLITTIALLYILFEFTNFEYYLNHAFTKLLQYVIVPVFAFGSIVAIKDSVKNIFKKEALSEGIIIYLLWWVWVLLLCIFAFGMCVMTYKTYFE